MQDDETTPVDGQAEAARYVKAFGNQGAIWYSRGMSFEAAQEKYARELKAYVERQKKSIAEKKARSAEGSE